MNKSSTASNTTGGKITPQSRSPPSKAGVIAGGTVGSIAALVIFGFVAGILIRRRRHKVVGKAQILKSVEVEGRSVRVERSRAEMDAADDPIEMPQWEVATTELPNDNGRSELKGRPSFSD